MFLCLVLGATPAAAFDIEDPTRGRLLELAFDSPTAGAVELLVYVPPGYFLDDVPTQRYPVLYWLHSSVADEREMLQALAALPGPSADTLEERAVARVDALIEAGTIEPMILVSIDTDTGLWTQAQEALVTVETPAFVDAHLRTAAHRGGRGLEGFSLGAQGVSLFATLRPDVFATASLLGGAFLADRWPLAVDAVLREDLEVALTVGDSDQNLPGVLDLADTLDTLDVPHELRVAPGIGHSVSGLYGALGVEVLAFHSQRFARERILDAGARRTSDAPLPASFDLAASIDDPDHVLDGATFAWQQVTGPGTASIDDPSALATGVTVTTPGVYDLRLEATLAGAPLDDPVLDDIVRLLAVDTGDSLALHLDFDAGDATDSSGNGRDGALVGMPEPSAGRLGGGLAFDGDDAVVVPDFSYGPAFTVALWLRADALAGGGYQYLASHGGFDVQPSMNLYLAEPDATLDAGTPKGAPVTVKTPAVKGTGGERLRSVVRDGDDGAGEIVTAGDAVDESAWHHVALVARPGGGHRLVVDGVERAAGNHGGDAIDPAGDLTFATRSVAPAGRYFRGLLDEVRVWDRDLPEHELQLLAATPDDTPSAPVVDAGADRSVYRDGGVVLEGTATDADGDTLAITWSTVDGPSMAVFADPTAPVTAASFDLPGLYRLRLEASDGTTAATDDVLVEVVAEAQPDLVGHWPVDPATPGAAVADASGLDHAGVLDGAPPPRRVCSPTGRALAFDAAALTVARIDGSPLLEALPGRDDFTVAGWLRAAPGAEGTLVARAAGLPGGRQLQVFLLDDDNDGASDLFSIVGGITNDEPQRLGARVDDGAWHHLALVHDAAAGTQQLYADGVPVGDAIAAGTASQDVPLLVGARRAIMGSDELAFHLDGALDDLRLYTRALTAAEVATVIADADADPGRCTPLFADDFESGGLGAWAECAPACT